MQGQNLDYVMADQLVRAVVLTGIQAVIYGIAVYLAVKGALNANLRSALRKLR